MPARTAFAAVVALVGVALALSGCGSAASAPDPTATSATPTPTAVSTAIPTAARVAFYGDSYTVGFGASTTEKRWSSVLSAERGWVEENDAQGGLGFLLNRESFGAGDRVEQIIADDPDAVIVMLGLNDVLGGYGDDPRVAERLESDITRLAEGLPDATLVVLETMWFKAERPPGLQTVIDLTEQTTEAVGGHYIAGASHWLDGHADWLIYDGLHPNDTGYAEIAARVDEALDAQGL